MPYMMLISSCAGQHREGALCLLCRSAPLIAAVQAYLRWRLTEALPIGAVPLPEEDAGPMPVKEIDEEDHLDASAGGMGARSSLVVLPER